MKRKVVIFFMKKNFPGKLPRYLCIIAAAGILSACGSEVNSEQTADLIASVTAAAEQAIETPAFVTSDTQDGELIQSVQEQTEVPQNFLVLPTQQADDGEMVIRHADQASETEVPAMLQNNYMLVLPTQNANALPVIEMPTATVSAKNQGDKAAYLSQSPEDGAHVERGSEFDVIWNLENIGTTTWTTDYCLRYFTGTNFTKPGKNRYYLNDPVQPNTVGKCIVDALAPEEPGTYKMSVVLGNEDDKNFFIVDITIVVD